MSISILPPSCQLGYTRGDLEQILAEDIVRFDEWMWGQGAAICDGQRFNHETREHEETGCGPHGVAVYPWDLARYFAEGRSRGLTCSRCHEQTGNNNQGHFWAYCKVTRTVRDHHFCCPGNCELEAAS